MEIRIQTLKFNAGETLNAFVEKKVSRLSKFVGTDETTIDVTLSLDKEGKTAKIQAMGFVIERSCDTFEDAITVCVDAMKEKLTREKEKKEI